MRQHARPGFDLEVPVHWRRQAWEASWPRPAVNGHDVATAETVLWDVGAHRTRYTRKGPLEYASGRSSS